MLKLNANLKEHEVRFLLKRYIVDKSIKPSG